jgi:hypothetical protein
VNGVGYPFAVFVRGRRLALTCALAAMAVAGCSSGGSKPVSLPSLTPSTSASPTPSATSTTTELSAVSTVVRRYFALINGPTTEAAATELFSIMTAPCKCRRVASSVRDAAKRGQSYFGMATITSFVPTIDAASAADVLVDYDSTASGLRDSKGHVLHRDPPMKGMSADFRLVRVDGVWRIDIVQIIRDGRPA